MKRRLVLLFILLFSCTMLFGTRMAYASESKGITTNMFELALYADDSLKSSQNKVDLSGIKVDVYSSELTDFDEESSLSEFAHNYALSVYTDSRGIVQFSRPSDEMLILIDVATLPQNTGIAISTKFYRKDIAQDKLPVSKVDKIVIEKDFASENDYYVNAYNEEGTRINVEYSLTESRSEVANDKRTVCLEARVGDLTETYEYTIPVRTNNTIEVQCVKNIDELLVDRSVTDSLGPDDFTKHKSFGHFIIYYNSSSDTTPLFISSLASALQEADTSLVNGLSLNRPRTNSQGTLRYEVYVTDMVYGTGSPAVCSLNVENGTRVSNITFYGITNLNNALTLKQQGTAAHEYMHAIIHTYSGNVPSWFHEGWAHWSKVRVTGIDSLQDTSVDDYLSITYKSFFGEEHCYGKMLMPLYIEQNYGVTAVANSIKNLANTTSATSAISNALPSGVTFQSIFPNFMGYNYAPNYFYDTYLDSWSDHPYITWNYPLNGYPNDAYGGNINSYAAHYREFDVPTSGSYNLDITIRITDNPMSLSGRIHMTSNTGVVTNWSLSSGYTLVTYSTTIGVPYNQGAISITNTSNNQTSYHITIARS